MTDINENNQDQAHHIEAREAKRKARITRFLETLNYIILPIQYVIKDFFLLFSSYNTALNVAIPALKFMCKNLSWLYGVSFILEGLCALIEATHSDNEDKRGFLIAQGSLLILGGCVLAALALTNPQIFLPLLCALWGASTLLFLYDATRDYIKNKRHLNHQLQTLRLTKKLLNAELDPEKVITAQDNEKLLNELVIAFNNASSQLRIDDVDTHEMQAEIMEKVFILQDQKGYATAEDIDNIIQGIIEGEKFNARTNNNIFLSAAYITASFVCALTTFIFLGKSDIQQTAIFSHILITTGMIAKRFYDFVTNPIIFKAQFENISSKDMDQLNDDALKEKYLKKKLKRLDKRVRRLLKPDFDKSKLQIILKDYAATVKEINEKDSPYTILLSELSDTLVNDNKNDEEGLLKLALALQQSIRSRMIYLGSNHSCVLCSAMRELEKKQSVDVTESESETLGQEEVDKLIQHENKPRLTYSLKDITLECGKILTDEKKQALSEQMIDTRSNSDTDDPYHSKKK